jgi:hypothetical protein
MIQELMRRPNRIGTVTGKLAFHMDLHVAELSFAQAHGKEAVQS